MQRTLKLWRTFKEGMTNFRRNGWLSLATIIILSLSLFIISLAGLITVGTRLIVSNLENRISITVSFNPDVNEGRILEIKQYLERAREIASIEYVSRDQALDVFLENNGSDPIIRQAIDEIGENPLLASLVIHAKQQSDYQKISTFLEASPYRTDINRINFEKNRKIFERLKHIGATTRKFGLAVGGAFGLIAILITFNTIRITIYSHRQEFEIMRLVGASNLYVRMPYIFEGILYGIFAGVTAVILVALSAYGLSGYTEGAFPQGNIFQVFTAYLPTIAVSTICLGIFLGVISSFIAIHRYLKA
ncbi:MAG: ABC transporter permease [Candidatus Moraniibacteriota bacterium]|nr:MAG: ABC transporter permease [Candidatus Moranbacteria bacterium]